MTLDKQKLERNQAKNDQAQKELDQELSEALEGEGEHIEPSEDEKPEEDEKPKEESEEEEAEEESEEEAEEEAETEDEEEAEEEEKPEKKNPDKKPSEKEDENPEPKVERPQKYIPLKKYQDEKKDWKEVKEDLIKANEKIEELEKIDKKDQTKAEENEDIKKLAEKWDTPVDFINELMETINKGNKVNTKTIIDKEKEKADEEPAGVKPPEVKEKTQEEIIQEFDTEFDTFATDLKKTYPEATIEQIEDAKKAMDEFAHSPEFKKYPLGHIMKINSKDFDLILGSTPKKQGVEGGRAGGAGPADISQKVFKKDSDGNFDFSDLHKMPEGVKKSKLVDALPLEAWDAYVQDLDTEAELKVSKNDGRIVSLS